MQANQTEQFLDRLLPHLFFLDSDPSKVIQRENDFIAGTKRVLPHADQELLGEVKNLKPSGVQALTVVGLLDSFFGSTLVDRGEALGDTFVKVVEDLREQYADNEKFRAAVRSVTKSGPIPWATRFIVRELVARFLVDARKNVTRNDAFDWFHTVVPLAYCQAMLLDGN